MKEELNQSYFRDFLLIISVNCKVGGIDLPLRTNRDQ
jgi:hypothetical protein